MSNGNGTTLPAPQCACHDQPMWRNGSAYGRRRWVCRVTEGERNAERIRVGSDSVFVGRARKFGASKQQVKDFISRTREEHDGKNR